MGFPAFASDDELAGQALAAERGRAFGAAWRREIESSLTGYLALFRAFGTSAEQVRSWAERALQRTSEWAPSLADEMAGLAAGAGLEPWQAAALNARTEILAATAASAAGAASGATTGPGECSTSVVLPAGGGAPRTIQTWDWRDTLVDVPLVWRYQPRPGHVVRGFTEFGVLGKVGVNSAGLGVHFNILQHDSDHDRIGVPVHIVARRILDEAEDVGTATDIARSARTSASTVLTVVSYDGERGQVAGLELCPDGVGVVPPGPDGVYRHTNHFLDPALAAGQRVDSERPTTYERLEHLRMRVHDLAAPEPTTRANALGGHAADGAAACVHAAPDEPFHLRSTTLATICLDLAGGQLVVHRGGPCQVDAATWQVV